jgi:starch-binding outer membrane protein, SusD/RagB family
MKKLLYIFSLAAFLLNGCGVLEVDPVNSIDTDEAVTNASEADRALLGVYAALQVGDYYGLRYLYYQDVYADNLAHAGTFTTDQEVSARLINPTNLQIRNTWQALYRVIGRANTLIEAVATIDVTTEQRNRLIAEARFLRALAHYDLLRMWGGVPYIDQATTSSDNLNLDGRLTENETYIRIVEDLLFAEANLLDNAGNRSAVGLGNRPFRASSMAASALLARVYLQKGDYADAVAKSTLVIESGLYSLQTNFRSLFEVKGNSEMILELSFSINDQNSLSISSNPATGGQKFYLRQPFYEQFLAAGQNGDTRFNASVLRQGTRNRVVKYFRSGTGDDNVPLIRLAEMYLIRAEATARSGVLGAPPSLQTVADIETIRLRANPSATPLVVLTNEEALTQILLQRRYEFAFEGQRYSDLKRYGLAPQLFQAGQAFRVLWPIPFQQLEVNSNLEQNPGYGG